MNILEAFDNDIQETFNEVMIFLTNGMSSYQIVLLLLTLDIITNKQNSYILSEKNNSGIQKKMGYLNSVKGYVSYISTLFKPDQILKMNIIL